MLPRYLHVLQSNRPAGRWMCCWTFLRPFSASFICRRGPRRDAGLVERRGLEKSCGRERTEGSTPSPPPDVTDCASFNSQITGSVTSTRPWPRAMLRRQLTKNARRVFAARTAKKNSVFQFFRDNIRWLTIGFLTMFAASFGQTYFVALSVADIRDVFGLTSGEFGVLFMALSLGSAIFLSQVGFLLDRLSHSFVLATSLSSLAIGAVIVAEAPSLLLLVAGLFLVRFFGLSALPQCNYTSIGRWFAGQRGLATSLTAFGMHAGKAVLPMAFVLVAARFDWRMAWIFVALLLILVLLPALATLARRDRTPNAQTEATQIGSAVSWTKRQALRDPYFYVLLLWAVSAAAIYNAVLIHHFVLFERRGWDPHIYAVSCSVFAVVAVCALPLAGRLVDRYSALRVLPFYLVPLGIGCLLLAQVSAEWSMFGFMALFALTDGFAFAFSGSLWPSVYGTRHLGAIRGVTAAALTLGASLGPGISGLLIDAGVDLSAQIEAMGFYCFLMVPALMVVTSRVARRLSNQAPPDASAQQP